MKKRKTVEKKLNLDTSIEHMATLIDASPDLYDACKQALGLLTEPGIMDADEWKVWRKETVDKLTKVDKKQFR